MRTLGRAAVLVTASLMAMSASPDIPSATGAQNQQFPLFSEFQVRGSHGYRITVLTVSNFALLHAATGQVSAEYAVRGRLVGNRLVARFAGLGRISVEFRASNRGPDGECEFAKSGVFRGRIEFRGERGFTDVETNRARGGGLVVPPAACLAAAPTEEGPLGNVTTRLHAISKRSGRTTAVDVFGFPGRARALVAATLEERRGAMRISRSAFALVGGRNAFVSSGAGKHPAFAFLKPPKPFGGNATFEQTGESSSSWNGTLTAWLPGAGQVQLAGPAFASNLCRRLSSDPECPLDPVVRRPAPPLAQGSGSQSQDFGEARLSWSRYLLNSASSAGSTP